MTTINNNNSSSSGGVGFVGLLTLVFIVLKLTGYIMWSWWWVLSPIWISLLILIVLLITLESLPNGSREQDRRKR